MPSKTSSKRGRKPAAQKAKPAVAARTTKVVDVHAAKDGERQCAARPQGPYGINAKERCVNATRRPTAALCAVHEPMWREEARRRASAKKATEGTSQQKRGPKAKAPTSDAELEAQLEASNAAFATPQLAQKHRQKRAAASA